MKFWPQSLFGRLIPAYLLALIPGLMTLAGLILVIEMTFRLMVKASEGTRMNFVSVPLDAAAPVPWIVAAVLLVGGLYLFRRTWPFVADAWQHAHAEMQQARRSAA